MPTNCDIEELRHMAQQKFIELVESGAQFQDARYYFMDQFAFRHGNWLVGHMATSQNAFSTVKLEGEVVWKASAHLRLIKKKKDGTNDKRDEAKAIAQLSEEMAALNGHPMSVAIERIKKDCEERLAEARCRAMEESIRKSCETIAHALQTKRKPSVLSVFMSKLGIR